MGKAVMIIPKEVLKKLDLLKNNPKIKIDFDRITLVSAILIIVITIVFWNDFGLPDALFESFLKIISFIALIATLYQSWTGNDLFKFLRGEKSKDFSDLVQKVIDVMGKNKIEINNFEDFVDNFHYFTELMPYEYIENDDEISKFSKIRPEELKGSYKENSQALNKLSLYLLQNMMIPGMKLGNKKISQKKKAKKRKSKK